MKKTDSFSIDIILRHPSYSSGHISQALSVKPQGAHPEGDKGGVPTAQLSFFYASLEKGEGPLEYQHALASVAQFLETHTAFWTDFMVGHGELELVLNHALLENAKQGDLCLKLNLNPRFLAQLSNRGFGLRVQAWKGG